MPFAASDDLGWVAWVDPAGENPRLLVYDVAQADIIGELDLPPSESGPQEEPDTRPIAIDQRIVYFVSSEGARAWQPESATNELTPSTRTASTTSRPAAGCSSSTPSGSASTSRSST